jgi:peroxiredoxin
MDQWIKTLFLPLCLLPLFLGSSVSYAQQIAPFTLPDLSGQAVSLTQYRDQKAVVLLFTSANCPWVDKYESRIKALHRSYSSRGVAFIAINSNDSQKSPRDGTQVLRTSNPFPFAYLRDEKQAVSKRLGAEKTPQVFVLQPRSGSFYLVYEGVIDDFPLDADQVSNQYLKDAIEAVLSGQTPNVPHTSPQGCGIRWTNR